MYRRFQDAEDSVSRLCALHTLNKDMLMTTVTVLHNVGVFFPILF